MAWKRVLFLTNSQLSFQMDSFPPFLFCSLVRKVRQKQRFTSPLWHKFGPTSADN